MVVVKKGYTEALCRFRRDILFRTNTKETDE